MPPRRSLLITAVQREAEAIRAIPEYVHVLVAGVGRTNAAIATTQAILRQGPFDLVISIGVAGALPGSELTIGDVIVASSCIYAEEGIQLPDGFQPMDALGFPLGDFSGNTVPVDPDLHRALASRFPTGPIATVATCSGTDEAAQTIARRTGAVAEAMEGAAVVHAARRFNTPAIEIRAISNTTGDRPSQKWDLPRAFQSLSQSLPLISELVLGPESQTR